MWDLISSFVSLIIGVTYPTLPGGLPYTSDYVNTTSNAACYQPDPSNTITLSQSNLANVTNPRRTLNPSLWSSDPVSTPFTSDSMCRTYVLGNQSASTTRTFILVRKDVRISSCKVDELAGPYAKGSCPGWNSNAPQMTHRGVCTLDDYDDLRKVGDLQKDGQTLELFWTPFTHNSGCNYNTGSDINCGPGDQSNPDLKDFIYVLKKRDAFDPETHKNCLALWDAGSTNENACSHYFDVYLAQDLYNQMQTIDASETTPDTEMYFLKNIVENCQENTTFIPATESNLTIPPSYIDIPFVKESETNQSNEGKIIPQTTVEKYVYGVYIWNNEPLFFDNSGISQHLIKQGENTNPITVCNRTAQSLAAAASPTPSTTPPLLPTLAPLPNCSDQLGTISFKKEDSTYEAFTVYSTTASPQTFSLKSPNDPTVYQYTLTGAAYPNYNSRNSSLQLGNLPFITNNAWTWATPWCKPAVYLYPEKPMDLNVKLTIDGKITVSDPVYNPETGWNVKANPNGTLSLLSDSTSLNPLPYLYYEADINNVEIPKNGFVIPQIKLKNELTHILQTLGFNRTEQNDFLKYWLPRLTDKPYYFVTLLPENVINQKEILSLSTLSGTNPQRVTPDSLIRSRFVFEGLDTPIRVNPLTIPSHARTGFTLADWGGTIIGKSCTDITVK